VSGIAGAASIIVPSFTLVDTPAFANILAPSPISMRPAIPTCPPI